MLVYHERFEPCKDRLAVYSTLFKVVSARFSESYRRKVNLNFVAAVKDAETRGGQAGRVHVQSHARPHPPPSTTTATTATLRHGTDTESMGASVGVVVAASCGMEAEEDDVLDEAMEMMLDAVQDGYGEFEDDYDDADIDDDSNGPTLPAPTGTKSDADRDDEEDELLRDDDEIEDTTTIDPETQACDTSHIEKRRKVDTDGRV
jgi:hypothetical protein